MSKKTQYAARAEGCRRLAEVADVSDRVALREAEAGWLRLSRACFDSPFGPPRSDIRFDAQPLPFGRWPR